MSKDHKAHPPGMPQDISIIDPWKSEIADPLIPAHDLPESRV